MLFKQKLTTFGKRMIAWWKTLYKKIRGK